ncbi:MAG: hypothetical protein WEA09_02470 [Gemmatimonadota bacterium]
MMNTNGGARAWGIAGLAALAVGAALVGALRLGYAPGFLEPGTSGDEGEWASASPAMAQEAWGALETFVAAEGEEATGSLTLTEGHLASLMAFQLSDLIPASLSGVRLRTQEDLLVLHGRLLREILEDEVDAEGFLQLLPDTIPVEAQVRMVPGVPGVSLITMERVTAAGIPVPKRLHPMILRVLADRNGFQVRGDTLALHLPTGLASVYLSGGTVRLERSP